MKAGQYTEHQKRYSVRHGYVYARRFLCCGMVVGPPGSDRRRMQPLFCIEGIPVSTYPADDP